MKLKPADINRIMDENVPKPAGMRSAQDFTEETEAARDALLKGMIAQSSQSVARIGTTLPPPPKTLRTQIDGPNDFGAPTTATTTTTVEGSAQVLEEVSRVPLPPALRGGDLDKIESRADLMALLTSNLPLNELGLPKIIYRGDMLDWKLFQGNSPLGTDPTDRYKTMQQFLDTATLWLSYAEGFPALPTGEPLWAKLPFELQEHYDAFTDYCIMPGQRMLSKIQKIPTDQLTQWFHEGYWGIRVKCYDMLNTVHAAKMREQRILACENDHYLQAENMLNKLKSQMDNINWEVLSQEPDKFVTVMEKVIKLQRLALGQGSQGSEKKELRSETLEVTMRKLAQPNLVEDKSGADGGVDVRELLKNPDALASAQELIVSMSRHIVTTAPGDVGSSGE